MVLARIEAQEWPFCGNEERPAGGQGSHGDAGAFMLSILASAECEVGNEHEAPRTLERWLEDARSGWKYWLSQRGAVAGVVRNLKISSTSFYQPALF